MTRRFSTRRARAQSSIRGLALLALVAGGIFWLASPSGAVLDGWGEDFAKASAEASRIDHPLLLAFYMDHCSPCLAMKRSVLPLPTVREGLSDFVLVQVNADSDRELARRFRVYGTPTYVALNSDGTLLDQCEGYQSEDEFLQFLHRAKLARASAN